MLWLPAHLWHCSGSPLHFVQNNPSLCVRRLNERWALYLASSMPLCEPLALSHCFSSTASDAWPPAISLLFVPAPQASQPCLLFQSTRLSKLQPSCYSDSYKPLNTAISGPTRVSPYFMS